MKKIHFAIHDLNQSGGQDRSTLEILLRLVKLFPIKIHAFTVTDERLRPFTSFVIPNLRKPVFLKIIYFYFVLLAREFFSLVNLRNDRWVWHATGASHLRSSFIHLQFIHASWRDHRKPSPESKLRFLYRETLEVFNILMEKLCFREGKTYMAISQSVANDLKKYYGIQKNVYVVHHGVDPKKFFPLVDKTKSPVRNILKIPEDCVVGILVGSYERKGLEASIRAVSMAKESCANFKLMAIGDGDIRYFNKLIDSLGLKENVILVPKQSNILEYYQAADFFILPTQYEPFGLVITEALACGLPAIVSKCAGGAELLTHKEQGFLVNDPNNPAEISVYLKNILESKLQLVEMSKKARMLAEQRSWDQVAKEFENIFKKHLE